MQNWRIQPQDSNKPQLNMVVHVQVCEHCDDTVWRAADYDDVKAPGNGEAIGMSNKSQTPSESSRLK